MTAKRCADLEEVRREIDRIDGEIVRLIAERGEYVAQAAGFKRDRNDVKAPDRVEAVIAKVRQRSAECGGDPDIAETVYRAMIGRFIEAEMSGFDS